MCLPGGFYGLIAEAIALKSASFGLDSEVAIFPFILEELEVACSVSNLPMPPLLCWVAHNDAIRRHKDSAFAEEDNQGFVPLSSDSRSRSGQNLRKQQDLPTASCRLELTGWKMEYCGPSSSRKSGATAGPVVLLAVT